MDIKKKIDILRSKIRIHNHEYYQLNNSSIDDYEYDALMTELRNIETQYPEYNDENSPTNRVGGVADEQFEKVAHAVKMESLQDVFSFDSLRDFDSRIRQKVDSPSYVVEPKIDGLSVSLVYENGILLKGVTRGNGEIGEDVTANILTIKSVPKTLPKPINITVRGEVYMPRDVFNRIALEQEQAGEQPFKNPRNAAAGSLRQKDSRVTAERNLELIIFNLQQGDITSSSHEETISILAEMGFITPPCSKHVDNIDKAIEVIDNIAKQRKDFDFDIDGAVVKLDNIELRPLLGSTSKFPRWAAAFKYPPEEKITKLIGVSISVGRTGAIIPTADLEPVILAGTTVARAALHNRDFIADKDIRIGDTVLVRKAGDIIPEIVRVIAHDDSSIPYEFPSECPSCKADLVDNGEEVALRCVNPNCPEQRLRGIIHYASRSAMDIEGLGDAVAHQLVLAGLVKNVEDIYALTTDQLLELEGFAQRSAENLINAISESKKQNLDRLVFAFGIKNVGARAATLICEHFKTLDAIAIAEVQAVCEIDGIGPIIAQSMCNYFLTQQAMNTVASLKSYGVNTNYQSGTVSAYLEGRSFVVTGTIPGYSRDEAKVIIQKHGGKVTASVSKKTDFLLCGEDAGSKLKKAVDAGVRVISMDELLLMIEGN